MYVNSSRSHGIIPCSSCPSFLTFNRIGGVMISVLASSAVDLWFELRSGHYLTICDIHAASRSKSKDCLDRYQDNVSEWCDMSTRELLLKWACTMKTQLVVLVYWKTDIIIISLQRNLFLSWCNNYLCNQCLSPLTLWVRIPLRLGVLDTT